MSGFEFTPAGIVPLGTYREGQTEGAIAGAVVPPPPVAAVTARPVVAAAAPISPRDVVRLARARLKDVEREIKRLHKLEAERDELKRLLDAAAGKPLALVRSLPTRAAKPA